MILVLSEIPGILPSFAAAEKTDLSAIPLMPLDENLEFSNEKPAGSLASDRTISLRACLEEAFANNREITSARYTLPIAKAAITIAGAVPNPIYTLQYGFGPAWTNLTAGDPQQTGLRFDLQTAGKRTKQIDVARSNYAVSEFQVAQLMFDVHNRVRRAYATQAAAEAYEDLIESQRQVALELVDVADKRFKAGKAPRSELLQAQLGVLQLETQRNQAQARLQQATAALSLITGELPQRVEVIDVDDNGLFKLSAEKTDLVPSPDRTLPSLDQLIPAAYAERPDMKVQVQQKYADRKSLTQAKSLRIPDVIIEPGFLFSTFAKSQQYSVYTNPITNQAVAPPNITGWYINATVETPIFYHHQGEVDQAKANWLQDFDQIKQLRAQIAADSTTAYESVTGARANIFKFQKELIPQAALVAKQAFRRYQVGKSDLASAILARQQYQQILSSYFDAVVAYQNAWADLEKAIGVSLNI